MLELVRQRARYFAEFEANHEKPCYRKLVAFIAATALVLQIAEMFYHAMIE